MCLKDLLWAGPSGASALLLAEFGAPAWVFVILLVWLLTLGLPTLVAILMLAQFWQGPSFPVYLLCAVVLAFLLQLGSVSGIRLGIRREISRRDFIGSLAMVGAGLAVQEPSAFTTMEPPWDFHVHLFGRGDGGTGCRLSPKQRQHWKYPFFLKLLNLSQNGSLDQEYVGELVRQLQASSIQKAVLLARDARYDEYGNPDFESTNFYVPNTYLFSVVKEKPELFVPCASINPKRQDVIEELERCNERGAYVVKVHPQTQDVNPADERFRPFYRRVAELGTILMVHTGSKHSSEVTDHALTDPAGLLPALDEGCTEWLLPIPAWAATSIPSPSAKTYSKTWSHLQFNSQHLRHPCTLTADDCNMRTRCFHTEAL